MLSNLSLVFLSLLPILSAATPLQTRANICGVKGYDRGNGNFDYNDSNKYSTYDACSKRCLAQARCKSFAYGGRECMLFDVAVNGNFDKDADSPTTYFDLSCISARASSSIVAPAVCSKKAVSTSTSKATTASAPSPVSSARVSTSSFSSTTSSLAVASFTSIPTTLQTSTSTRTAAAPPSAKTSGIAINICHPPASYPITNFSWFNSTHNLDCTDGQYNPSESVCFNSDNSVCDPRITTCSTCAPVCSTGTPPQPLGYGPPDSVSYNIPGVFSQCTQANPQSIRRYEVGEGQVGCGGAGSYSFFYGDSNKDQGASGSVQFTTQVRCDDESTYTFKWAATFPLVCSHDAGRNATCTAGGEQPEATVTGYSRNAAPQ